MKNIQTSNPEWSRQCILDTVFDARTLQEISEAEQLLREWMRQNPEDTGMREAFGGLSLMRDIAEEQEQEHRHNSSIEQAA